MSDLSLDITLDDQASVQLLDGQLRILDNTTGVCLTLTAPVVEQIRREARIALYGRATTTTVDRRPNGDTVIWLDPVGHVVLDSATAMALEQKLATARTHPPIGAVS